MGGNPDDLRTLTRTLLDMVKIGDDKTDVVDYLHMKGDSFIKTVQNEILFISNFVKKNYITEIIEKERNDYTLKKYLAESCSYTSPTEHRVDASIARIIAILLNVDKYFGYKNFIATPLFSERDVIMLWLNNILTKCALLSHSQEN